MSDHKMDYCDGGVIKPVAAIPLTTPSQSPKRRDDVITESSWVRERCQYLMAFLWGQLSSERMPSEAVLDELHRRLDDLTRLTTDH